MASKRYRIIQYCQVSSLWSVSTLFLKNFKVSMSPNGLSADFDLSSRKSARGKVNFYVRIILTSISCALQHTPMKGKVILQSLKKLGFLFLSSRKAISLRFQAASLNSFNFSSTANDLDTILCLRTYSSLSWANLVFDYLEVLSLTIFLPSLRKTPKAMSTFKASQTLLLMFCYSLFQVSNQSSFSYWTSLAATSLQVAFFSSCTISQALCDNFLRPFSRGLDFLAKHAASPYDFLPVVWSSASEWSSLTDVSCRTGVISSSSSSLSSLSLKLRCRSQVSLCCSAGRKPRRESSCSLFSSPSLKRLDQGDSKLPWQGLNPDDTGSGEKKVLLLHCCQSFSASQSVQQRGRELQLEVLRTGDSNQFRLLLMYIILKRVNDSKASNNNQNSAKYKQSSIHFQMIIIKFSSIGSSRPLGAWGFRVKGKKKQRVLKECGSWGCGKLFFLGFFSLCGQGDQTYILK